MNSQNDHDTYIIPPNFVDTGTFFGGMFKARNVIEAGILTAAIGLPLFIFIPLGLTPRIIILCLTALPLMLVALIGISGESLSVFLIIFLKYLKNRRIIGKADIVCSTGKASKEKPSEKAKKEKSKPSHKAASSPSTAHKRLLPKDTGDFPAEFDEVRGYELRQKLRPVSKKTPVTKKKPKQEKKKAEKETSQKKRKNQASAPSFFNPVAEYLPIEKVEHGIIYTKDHRFVKVVEVIPINFLLRSAREQRNIIYSFVSYLKISPVKLQFKVLTRRADIGSHLKTVQQEMEQ